MFYMSREQKKQIHASWQRFVCGKIEYSAILLNIFVKNSKKSNIQEYVVLVVVLVVVVVVVVVVVLMVEVVVVNF